MENELEQGLQNADNMTRDLTDEANRIIQSVSDIVSLPRLEDDEFALHVRQAKQQKQETIERLNEFDQQQTQALTHVRQELEKMHQYVQKIQSMFTSGEINISNFKIDQLDNVKAYQNIKTAIRPKGMNNSINEVWEVLFGRNANLLAVQYQLRNQLKRLMPLQFLPLGNGIGTQPSSYIPQDTFYPFGYIATPTNAYYTNDGKKVNITNLSNVNELTDEEINKILEEDGGVKELDSLFEDTPLEFLEYIRNPFKGVIKEVSDLVEKGVKELPKIGKEIKEGFGKGTGEPKKEKPKQVHHYATNKSKTYTHQLENVTKKYGLDLDDVWNKELLPHQGRHPNAYHEYVLDRINEYDAIARGNKEIFLELFEG